MKPTPPPQERGRPASVAADVRRRTPHAQQPICRRRKREENPGAATPHHEANELGERRKISLQQASRSRCADGSGAREYLAKEWRQRNEDKKSPCPHSFASIPLPNRFRGLRFKFTFATPRSRAHRPIRLCPSTAARRRSSSRCKIPISRHSRAEHPRLPFSCLSCLSWFLSLPPK